MKNQKASSMLKFINKLPLSWRHKIRALALSFEYFTKQMVIGESISHLIENNENPDFIEFDKKLEEIRKNWGIYDADIESLAVTRRLMAFKSKNSLGVN